ncbi:MAG: hypothetical protein WAM14_06385 [Candidatus Nitrosopolaris sp.]
MIERTYNDKEEIFDAEFEEIVKNQILKTKKIQNGHGVKLTKFFECIINCCTSRSWVLM